MSGESAGSRAGFSNCESVISPEAITNQSQQIPIFTCGPGSEEADLGGIGEVSGDVVAALRPSTRVPKVGSQLRCVMCAWSARF
jgi:hypothetical protein